MANKSDEPSLFDDDEPTIAVTVPEAPAVSAFVWPAFADSGTANAEHKLDTARTIIEFVEAGFPEADWKAGRLSFLITDGPFFQYKSPPDRYWYDHFSNSARQADWLFALNRSHHDRMRSGNDSWADVEVAVLEAIEVGQYASVLRQQGQVIWSAPTTKGAKGAGPTFMFESNPFSSGKEKAAFATTLVRFIENDFDKKRFTKSLYSRLSNLFFHIAHFDLHGFYYEWFSSTESQRAWFENALRQGRRWEDSRHGDYERWNDVETALVSVIKERNWLPQWTERAAQELEASERHALALLLEKYPDARPPAADTLC